MYCLLQLKKELNSFDPQFFEELEDLKYNHQKALEKNTYYEEKLKELGGRFGVNVDVPFRGHDVT